MILPMGVRLESRLGEIEEERDMVSKREVVPEDQNSSPHILAAAQLLPRDWPMKPAAAQLQSPNARWPLGINPLMWEGPLFGRLDGLEPVEALDDDLAPNGFFRASAKYMMPQVDEKSRK